MSRQYSFRDLATHSGASKNEVTKWVQKGLIRPDVRDTTGTGTHRVFGFLDLFEACVLRKLNQVPGTLPTLWLAWSLEAIRMATALDLILETGWSRFIDPQQRQPSEAFWLTWSPDGVTKWRVVRGDEVVERSDHTNAIVMLRLDTLFVDLERRTNDHATPDEISRAWRSNSDPNVVEPTDSPIEGHADELATGPQGMAARPKD